MRYCPDCRAEYAPGSERCHDCGVDLVDVLVEDDDRPVPEGLVTVASYDTPVRASILASRLDAEGIECFLADEQTIAVHNLLAGAVGGVKVQVRASDAARAAAIVGQQAAAPAVRACPRCGSSETRRKGMSFLVAFLAVMTLGVLALFFQPRWTCSSCAHTWS